MTNFQKIPRFPFVSNQIDSCSFVSLHRQKKVLRSFGKNSLDIYACSFSIETNVRTQRTNAINPTNPTNERKLVYSFNGYARKMTSAYYFLQPKDMKHMYIFPLLKVILRKVHFKALSGYTLFSALNAFLHFPSFGFCFSDYILVVAACFEDMYLLSSLILLLSHLYLNPCESKMTTSQVRSTESNHS